MRTGRREEGSYRTEKIFEEQKSLRSEMLSFRDGLSGKIRDELSQKICQNLLELEEFKAEENIYAYYPFGSEVDITQVLAGVYPSDKKYYLPRTKGDDMDFYSYCKDDKLIKGVFGVLEPDPDTASIYNEGAGFMIVPGVVFSREGYRIGYGKGFYDRYLAQHPMIVTAGVCFSGQLTDAFYVKNSDIPLDIIVTEKEIIHTGANL